ncbi:hypothetical protein C1646_768818 [Rhizophagus diaphanus]|nr:hypothetical protein C1646_768818 [Rhizophagus diaphanus] [Rhizophagus sp. MUCL 43196]
MAFFNTLYICLKFPNVDSDNNSNVDSEDLNDSANDDNENEMKSNYDVKELAQQHLLDDDLILN